VHRVLCNMNLIRESIVFVYLHTLNRHKCLLQIFVVYVVVNSVIFVLIYFLVLVLVLLFQLFFSFSFVLVFIIFRFSFSFASYFLVLVSFQFY